MGNSDVYWNRHCKHGSLIFAPGFIANISPKFLKKISHWNLHLGLRKFLINKITFKRTRSLCPKPFNFIDAFNCFKQKYKVVPSNMAHPVVASANGHIPLFAVQVKAARLVAAITRVPWRPAWPEVYMTPSVTCWRQRPVPLQRHASISDRTKTSKWRWTTAIYGASSTRSAPKWSLPSPEGLSVFQRIFRSRHIALLL